MKAVRSVLTLAGSVLLLAMTAACSDDQPAASRTSPEDAAAPSYSVRGRSPRDVPEVKIDLPAKPRAWDDNPAALAGAIADGEGFAVVAFKEPGSGRALATGRRAAVTAGTVRAGIQLLERHGAEILDLLDGIGGARVRISPQAAAEIAGHPLVDFVEPRQYGPVQAQTTPAGITLVQAPDFWTATSGVAGAGAKVEIIDTGWQSGHPDLPAVPADNCSGFFGGCDDSSTANWHGTHVFGIIAARNNADGVVGVAPGLAASDIYVYGACASTGSCPTDQVTAGINAGIWNVDVMNLSLVQPFSLAQSTAVAQAWNDGIVLVAAAGNNLTSTVTYPAGYTNVIGVSGVKSDKAFASTSSCGNYSNQGTHVDLAAPFEAYSTMGTDTYGTQCGTSMAAAHVTGAAALVKSKNPTWTNQQIADSLFAWAEDLGTAGRDNLYGYGLVRPHRVTPVSATISGTSTITTTGSHSWTAVPTGGNGAYTYLWEYRVSGAATWTQVATTQSYGGAVTSAQPSFELRVTVTSAGLIASDEHAVTVTFPPAPVISGPTSVTAAGTQTWTTSVTGGNGTYSYNWEYRVLGGAWASVGTGSSYSRSVAPGNASFELRVSVTSGGLTGSDTHVVNVAPTANISGSSSISAAGTYVWSANAAGGNGTYTYQWEYRTQGATTWTQVGTAASYSRSVATSNADFELRVTVTSGGLTGSDTHLVAVTAPTTANITGATYITTTATYTWQANAAGGNGAYTYAWEYRPQGSATWTQVGTASSYSRSVSNTGSDFELRVTVTSAGFVGVDVQLVTVNPPPPTANITGPTSTYAAQGTTFQANASGGNGTYTYQWQYRLATTTTWTNVGTGGSSYTRTAPNGDFHVRVTVTSGGLSASDEHAVNVCNPLC